MSGAVCAWLLDASTATHAIVSSDNFLIIIKCFWVFRRVAYEIPSGNNVFYFVFDLDGLGYEGCCFSFGFCNCAAQLLNDGAVVSIKSTIFSSIQPNGILRDKRNNV